jgi:hypothetical protein
MGIGDNKSNGAEGSLAASVRQYREDFYPDVKKLGPEYPPGAYLPLRERLIGQTIHLYQIHQKELTSERARPVLHRGRLTGPVKFAALIMESWRLSLREITLLLGYEPGDESYVEEILDGFITSRGRDFKDRIACLYVLHSLLTSLFRCNDSVNEWLREAQPLLDQQSPLQTLLQGSMENMFRVRYLVEQIAGR